MYGKRKSVVASCRDIYFIVNDTASQKTGVPPVSKKKLSLMEDGESRKSA